MYPASFICPITQEVMVDPVTDPDGNSYERLAIIEWLQRKGTSPVTRRPLRVDQLIPNRALKDLIDEQLKRPTTAPCAPVPHVVAVGGKEQEMDERVKVTIHQEGVESIVTIIPPPGNERVPCDMVCAIDISGSMGTEAKVQNGEGRREGNGLSLLDIVKHAVRTLIHTLDSKDRLALVAFETTATLVFDFLPMDAAGKKTAQEKLEKLMPEDCTNLWDGLKMALDLVGDGNQDGRMSTILLLTDGLPNIAPPRGHEAMLERYLAKRPRLPCSINTFGFGYELDSSLLEALAVQGEGSYCFIPDSSFVGTVFIHALSNALVTFGTNVVLEVTGDVEVAGPHLVRNTGKGKAIHIGPLQYGQTKDVVLRGTPTTVVASYRTRHDPDRVVQAEGFNGEASDIARNRARLRLVDAMRLSIAEGGQAQEKVKQCLREIAGFRDLEADLKGQVLEAISRDDWFRRWGQHYLRSIARAHLLQQCNNFKDPGVQAYGGALFNSIRDTADDIFGTLPPPKPSRRSSTTQAPISSPQQFRRRYHSANNPCYHGACTVGTPNGAMRVDQLRRGDVVCNSAGEESVVECVLRTEVPGVTELVAIRDLLVTPYHPVFVNGDWKFPCDVAEVKEVACKAVYSFVLRGNIHTMSVGGVDTITLGHGFKDPVLAHAYFGTNRVLDDLRRMIGWEDGLIALQHEPMLRDPDTGDLVGFLPEYFSECPHRH